MVFQSIYVISYPSSVILSKKIIVVANVRWKIVGYLKEYAEFSVWLFDWVWITHLILTQIKVKLQSFYAFIQMKLLIWSSLYISSSSAVKYKPNLIVQFKYFFTSSQSYSTLFLLLKCVSKTLLVCVEVHSIISLCCIHVSSPGMEHRSGYYSLLASPFLGYHCLIVSQILLGSW